MRFRIFRTSQHSRIRPCLGAAWDEAAESWTIEIPDLENLLSLFRQEGPLVIDADWDDAPQIEIYDAYRE